jgi:hypothetical protein
MWMRDEKCFQDAIDGMLAFLSYVMTDCYRMPQADTFSWTDPYYQAVVRADEEEFADGSKTQVIFGWEEIYIENGELTK